MEIINAPLETVFGQLSIPFCFEESTDFVDCLLVLKMHFVKRVKRKSSVACPDRYFRAGALSLSVCALCAKRSGTLPLAYLC